MMSNNCLFSQVLSRPITKAENNEFRLETLREISYFTTPI